MTRPFEGIRVIDVTHVLAGPFAAYQLAVLGADVIKVEHPDEPDQSRGSGTDKALNRRNMGTAFLTQASNKRSIALDLKQPGDREVLKKLVATADVFVTADLLVASNRSGAFGLYQLRSDSPDTLLPVLVDGGGNVQGVRSPDRTRIAYSSSRGGSADVYVMDADGKNPRRVTADPGSSSGRNAERTTAIT